MLSCHPALGGHDLHLSGSVVESDTATVSWRAEIQRVLKAVHFWAALLLFGGLRPFTSPSNTSPVGLVDMGHSVLGATCDHGLVTPHGFEESEHVFYHKMKADYYRYMAEPKQDANKLDAVDKARKAHEEACEVARIAFEDAMAEHGNEQEGSYTDPTLTT